MKKIWIWLFSFIGMLIIICAFFSLVNVLNGGSVPGLPDPRSMNAYWEEESSGVSGVMLCLCNMIIGLSFILLPRVNMKKGGESPKMAVYPNCRWWQDREGKWYSEENPQMEKKYPEDGICPLCHKKIEKLDIGT